MKKGLYTMVAVIMAALLTILPTSNAVSALTILSGDDIINITDPSFLQVLINEGVDINKDGKISVNEMESLQSLNVFSDQITDFSGFEYAKNLTFLYLNVSDKITNLNFVKNMTKLNYVGVAINNYTDAYTLDISALSNLTELGSIQLSNCGISDISALKNLLNLRDVGLKNNKITDISSLGGLLNLSYLSLDNNQITDITSLKKLSNLVRLELGGNNVSDAAKFDLTRVSFGQMFKGQQKSGQVLPMGLLNGVSMFSENQNIISLGDYVVDYGDVKALSEGDATIKLQYGDLTKSFIVKVNGIVADQPLDANTSGTAEFYKRAALNSNGELWNLSDNGPNVVKNNVNKYVAYDTYEGDINSPVEFRLAVDNNKTLWSWGGDTYSDGKTTSFQDNKREMENVKYVNTRYAVTYNNELFDYCKDDGKLLDNVKEVERINDASQYKKPKIGTEVLKTDNTLWVRRDGNLQQTSGIFVKAADGVRQLTSSDEYSRNGYIKDDGTYWLGSEVSPGNIGFTKVADNVSFVKYGFIVKTDGTVMSPDGTKVILTTGLKEVKESNGSYLVDNNNTLWSWNSYSGAQKVSDGFKEFTEDGFIKIDGTMYDYYNNQVDYQQKVYGIYGSYGDVTLSKDNVLYVSGVKILTNVTKLYRYEYGYGYDNRPIYAVRTDGSMWEVGNMVPTKLLNLSSDINHDGAVDMIDLAFIGSKYNAKSTSTSYNSDCDFNKDNIIDIYDVVSVSRRLTI
jgi:hypothetical protein